MRGKNILNYMDHIYYLGSIEQKPEERILVESTLRWIYRFCE